MTGADPEGVDRVWWEPDLAGVFRGLSDERLEASLRTVDRIVHVVESDGHWNGDIQARNAYRIARYWIASGRWDLVLVVLTLEGRTATWPEYSARWGSEPFNKLGFPNTGLFSILTLKQAAMYSASRSPDRYSPFPMREQFLRASNWRSARSPLQDLDRNAWRRNMEYYHSRR